MAKKITKKSFKTTNTTALLTSNTITVKNADGEADTTAEILVQNKISYTPKVSVIIPVYNVENYLRECLDSVVNQTLREIEIICVDDGSTDGSLDILKEYAARDNRITVITQKNLHAGVARNAGLSVACGEYLSFLDSDDFFETNMFEKMHSKATRTSAEICTCHVRIYNMSKETYENCSWGLHDDMVPSKQPFGAKDICEKIYQFNQGWVWDTIYKKSFIEKNKVHFQSQRSSNDVFFCFCNLALATKIIVIPDVLVTHRLHVKGSLENTREKSYFNIVNAVTKIKEFLEERNLYQDVKVSFVNFAISNFIWNYETLKEPTKTFLLEYVNKFYKELFNSIDKKQYFNQANYEKMQNMLNKRRMGTPADYIPVVLATNKNYCLPCVVTINSIIQNADKNKKYAVFVLHSELDNTDIEHLENLCTDNVFVHCISVDINRLVGNNFDYTTAHYSKEMYYRILIPDMFGIYNKVIYIDCDLVLNTDIANLYQTDLGNNVIAAIINPVMYSADYIKNTLGVEPEKYFNSGVLIINTKRFKELKIKERCLNLLQEIKSLRFPDQDVLNVACKDSVLYLDIRWNYQWFFKIDNIQLPTYCKEQYDAASSNPYIIHYSSGKKPWKMRNLRYAESWWKYAKGTPAYMFYAKQIDYKQELCDWYFRLKKEKLNLDNPQTFNEKMQWLKLYDSTPEKTLLADKYLVRDWVAKTIGEEYLIPILGVYDSFDEIDFDKLPNQFVMKCNHGSGWNIVVEDKNKLDMADAKSKIDRWMNDNYAFKCGLELHYRDIPPKIVIEKFMSEIGNALYDYRFFCFDGRVEQIWLDIGSGTSGHKRKIYDRNWKELDILVKWPRLETDVPKPKNLEKMINLAEKMSTGFAMVRVDFYDVNDKIYFGEMTFTSMSGTGVFEPASADLELGKLIKLPKLAYNIDTGEYYELPKTTPIKNKKNKTNRIKPYLLFSYYLCANLFMRIARLPMLKFQKHTKSVLYSHSHRGKTDMLNKKFNKVMQSVNSVKNDITNQILQIKNQQNNLAKQINEISVGQKNAANERFATLSKQISDLEKAFATNADETKANIQSVRQDIENTNNRISDTKKSLERNQVLYFNPWSTNLNAERGNCDMVSAPNFEERFKKLMAGLPDESAETVVKIIRRLQMIKGTNSALDLFTDEEKAQLKKVRNLNNEILKVSDNLYAYKNYMLPINHFEASVFVYNHGISQLNSVDTFKDKDILDVGGFIGDSVLMLAPLTTGKVHSFEATTENYNNMLKTIELNGIKNAVPVHTAVGDKPGEIELRFSGSASSQDGNMVKNPQYIEKCPIIKIDDYVREHNLNVGLIKVDIEGAEQSFLRGAYDTIRTQKPTLLISIYHNVDDFLDIKPMIESWNLGYKFKIFKPTIESVISETLLICECN